MMSSCIKQMTKSEPPCHNPPMYSLAWIHNKQKGQAVLRLLDQLHRSVVLRLEREELAVLLLTCKT